MNQARILYEDQDIIVCHKPAGIATQTARVGQADMVSEVKNYLARTRKVPYVGVVHRLDQPVEGILVFAGNKQAAAVLGRQITENCMEKYYYAVVCGSGYQESGVLTDYLVKDGRTNISRIVPPEVKGAKKAVLEYEILSGRIPVAAFAEQTAPMAALAGIRLLTGRHHQIRVQMSSAGMSLFGDYKYGDAQTVELSEHLHVKEIALCAGRLSFTHPRTGRRMEYKIRPEGKIFQEQEFIRYYA